MMLRELGDILAAVPSESGPSDYEEAIVAHNVLGKPTQATRTRTAKRLTELYGLDPTCTVFRLLRHFWEAGPTGRPMLAFLAASARDPLLREATTVVLAEKHGSDINSSQIADRLKQLHPGRFRDTTLLSTAQNLASSWTQAGYLAGKVRKTRTRPNVLPHVAAFAVVLGYLCGLRGKLLLDSAWTRLLDRSPSEIVALITEASRQGWLTYKSAGSVVEITLPGLLRPQEEKAAV